MIGETRRCLHERAVILRVCKACRQLFDTRFYRQTATVNVTRRLQVREVQPVNRVAPFKCRGTDAAFRANTDKCVGDWRDQYSVSHSDAVSVACRL